MNNNISNLPVELVEKICAFMDDGTLVALRQTSRRSKAIADKIIIKHTKNPVIGRIVLIPQVQAKTGVHFSFDNVETDVRLKSKRFLLSAAAYSKNATFEFDSKGQGMLMKLMISEIAEFFHLLTSLEKTVTIVTLEMFNSELFALIVETKFFDGKTIPNLAFVYDESLQHRDILMQHIIQFQSTAIQLHIGESFPHIDSFLVELADRVDSIYISSATPNWLNSYDCSNNRVENLFYRILTKRCSYLDVSDAFVDLKLNPAIKMSTDLYTEFGGIRMKFYFAARSSRSTNEKLRLERTKHIKVSNDVFAGRKRLEIRSRLMRKEW